MLGEGFVLGAWFDHHDGDDVVCNARYKNRVRGGSTTYSTARSSSPPLSVSHGCRGQDGSDGCGLHLVCCSVGESDNAGEESLLKTVRLVLEMIRMEVFELMFCRCCISLQSMRSESDAEPEIR